MSEKVQGSSSILNIINGLLLQREDFQESIYWRRETVLANDLVIRQGENGNDVFLLETGRVRVLGNIELGPTRTVRPGVKDLGPGEVFGELALFDAGLRSASVMAVESSELIRIDGDRLLTYLESHSDIGFLLCRELITVVVGRLRDADKKMFSLLAWGLRTAGDGKE